MMSGVTRSSLEKWLAVSRPEWKLWQAHGMKGYVGADGAHYFAGTTWADVANLMADRHVTTAYASDGREVEEIPW